MNNVVSHRRSNAEHFLQLVNIMVVVVLVVVTVVVAFVVMILMMVVVFVWLHILNHFRLSLSPCVLNQIYKLCF